MSWALRRRLIVTIIVGALIVSFLAVVLISALYKAPSCTDGVQNQGEQGIDCGGPCAYLCTALMEPPTVLYTQAIGNGEGRIDVVATVENKNLSAAAKRVPYSIQLFNAKQQLVKNVQGYLDLPPGATVPVYIPGMSSGAANSLNAFLTVSSDAINWYTATRDPRIVPTISNVRAAGSTSAPRVAAVMTNPGLVVLANVRAVVLVRNDKGDVIAASQTVVASLPPGGTAPIVFTWGAAFSGVPASIEIDPIIPLP